MNSKHHDDYCEKNFKLEPKYIKELIYFPIVLVFFVFYKFYLKEQIEDKQFAESMDLVFFLFSFGGVHVLASNMLACFYNQQRLMSPLAILATPRKLKILGSLICLFGTIFFLVKL